MSSFLLPAARCPLPASSFQRTRTVRASAGKFERLPPEYHNLDDCGNPPDASSKLSSAKAVQVPPRTLALPEARWKLEARSRKLSSHFLRERVSQPVEHEVSEQEEGDRNHTEQKQQFQVSDRSRKEQDLLIGDRKVREGVQLQERRLPDMITGVRGILELEPGINDRCREKPEHQQVREDVADVAEVHGQR